VENARELKVEKMGKGGEITAGLTPLLRLQRKERELMVKQNHVLYERKKLRRRPGDHVNKPGMK
jgi:hypothetical protein